jgi:hypothetical protein
LTDTYAHHVAVLGNYCTPQFPLLLAATAVTAMISARALNRVFVPINAILLVSNLILSIVLMSVLNTGRIALASSLNYALSLGLLMATLIRRAVINTDKASLPRFVIPYALLTRAGAAVFVGDLRVTKNTGLTQYAASIEARVHLLDYRMVKFARSVPLDRKRVNGITKWPLRQVLLPPALFERPKQGFAVRIFAWLRGGLRSRAADLLDDPSVGNYLDASSVRKLRSGTDQ